MPTFGCTDPSTIDFLSSAHLSRPARAALASTGGKALRFPLAQFGWLRLLNRRQLSGVAFCSCRSAASLRCSSAVRRRAAISSSARRLASIRTWEHRESLPPRPALLSRDLANYRSVGSEE